MLHVRWRLFHATEKINDFLVNYVVKRKNACKQIHCQKVAGVFGINFGQRIKILNIRLYHVENLTQT